MKLKLNLLVLGAVTLLLFSCDKTDCLYPDYAPDCKEDIVIVEPPPPPPEEKVVRKILFEEFTGPGCKGCPPWAESAVGWSEDTYSDRMIIIANHAGWFSSMQGNPFDFELTSDESEEYYQTFKVTSNPQAMINRRPFSADPGILSVTFKKWEESLAQVVGEVPYADLKLELDVSYDAATRRVELLAIMEYLEDLSGDYRIVASLTEDHLRGPQVDERGDPTPEYPGDSDWEDYDHRHALRENLNGAWGEYILQGDKEQGTMAEHAFMTYVLPEEYVADNCYLVVYVYNEATWEVIQAEEVPVKM